LVEKIPHRPYWDGFLFNNVKSAMPDDEGVISDDKRVIFENKNMISDDNKNYKNKEYDKLTFDII